MRNGDATERTCSEAFLPFLDMLSCVAQDDTWNQGTPPEIEQLLNGAASSAVTSHVPKHLRSRDGIFFSGHLLANKAVAKVSQHIKEGHSVYDPACGAGDLLIAAAWHMELGPSLEKTLAIWSRKLGGCDIHPGFVEAARWRLLMLAMLRHRQAGHKIAPKVLDDSIFSNICAGNYLDTQESGSYDCVITNPPFAKNIPENNYRWASGNIQLAGIFIDSILACAKAEQKIVAILPDVLRSGTRYGRWRGMVTSLSKIKAVQPHGRFDENTDVDVFILSAERNKSETELDFPSESWTDFYAPNEKKKLLGDLFNVNVGAVVPHRNPCLGQWHPYITVQHAKAFSELSLKDLPDNVRFDGRTFMPPMLVVRRTSNPSDKNRIIPTLVDGNRPVAIENHLLVITPKDGNVDSCRDLKIHLETKAAAKWLNDQIRCRHITTKAILSMPIEELISD